MLSLLMFFLLILGGCGMFLGVRSSATVSVSAENQVIEVGDSEGVIFSVENAESQNLIPYYIYEGTGYWTPSVDDVLALEAGLPDFLREAVEDRYYADVWERLDEYRRQYVGAFIDARQVIYANFFCAEFNDWESQIVAVEDGGACFFQVYYDVETGEFFDLYVNGEA